MTIDWPRRYALVRLHFAAELVLELVSQALPGVEKVGAHIAEDRAHIDFALPESIALLLSTIATQAQALIAADLSITSAFSDEAAEPSATTYASRRNSTPSLRSTGSPQLTCRATAQHSTRDFR
jgi:Ser-tRNA(Ala) deacylase AlaX